MSEYATSSSSLSLTCASSPWKQWLIRRGCVAKLASRNQRYCHGCGRWKAAMQFVDFNLGQTVKTLLHPKRKTIRPRRHHFCRFCQSWQDAFEVEIEESDSYSVRTPPAVAEEGDILCYGHSNETEVL